jgi:hypothetical protein
MHQSHCDYLFSSFRDGNKRFLFYRKRRKETSSLLFYLNLFCNIFRRKRIMLWSLEEYREKDMFDLFIRPSKKRLWYLLKTLLCLLSTPDSLKSPLKRHVQIPFLLPLNVASFEIHYVMLRISVWGICVYMKKFFMYMGKVSPTLVSCLWAV